MLNGIISSVRVYYKKDVAPLRLAQVNHDANNSKFPRAHLEVNTKWASGSVTIIKLIQALPLLTLRYPFRHSKRRTISTFSVKAAAAVDASGFNGDCRY